MNDFSIFYAWQSDLDSKLCRYFIRDTIKKSIKEINLHPELLESPRLDSDTQHVSGTPEIAGTIFNKIENASIFIADLSFIGSSEKGKQLSNPNVLLELGYAASQIGWERVILIMNTEFGPPENLAFDLKHRRWPITYQINTHDKVEFKNEMERLSNEIKSAILIVNQEKHNKVFKIVENLDSHCFSLIASFKNQDNFEHPNANNMGEFVTNSPSERAFIRLLDLSLIRCDFNLQEKIYTYRWTYLGKLVLKHLGHINTDL